MFQDDGPKGRARRTGTLPQTPAHHSGMALDERRPDADYSGDYGTLNRPGYRAVERYSHLAPETLNAAVEETFGKSTQ